MKLRVILAGLLALLGTYAAVAQDLGIDELTPDERIILNDINAARLRENLVHLFPATRLNQVAQQFVDDLQARPINDLGEVFRTRDDRGIEDLLQDTGYGSYSAGYVVDFIPVIVRNIDPPALIDFWRSDSRNVPEERTLLSRRAVRQGETILPIFSPLYREIGIAAAFNSSTERYYYVIIFAAQPNVLPVVITERRILNEIPQVVDTRDVILYVHDERVNRFGEGESIGAVVAYRITETGEELNCPTSLTDDSGGWQAYENELRYTLSAGVGIKTVFVQMCDDFDRSITSISRTTFQADPTGTPPNVPGLVVTPNVLNIANMTQTVAASATAYAPYAATVEAILTQTAVPVATETP